MKTSMAIDWTLCAVFVALVVGGCTSSDDASPAVGIVPSEATCPSPAPEWHCMHPWPSNFHRRGEGVDVRVQVPPSGGPSTLDGATIDLVSSLGRRGFSLMPMITALIPAQIDDSGLNAPLDDLSSSLEPTNPTLLIDASSGQLVAHSAEIDPRPENPLKRALVIHPAQPLKRGRRYVVAIHSLKTVSGDAVQPSETFAALRQGLAPTGSDFGTEQAAYYRAHVLPVLDQLGVSRDSLILAWDFTTGANLGSRLTTMVSNARKACHSGAETCGAVSDLAWSKNPAKDVAHRLTGLVRLPGFVDQAVYPSTHVSKEVSGSFDVAFTLSISTSAASQLSKGQPVPIIVMGHGFFGQRGEVDGEAYRAVAEAAGGVALAIDWWGLSSPDVGPIVKHILSDTRGLLPLRDRLEQGVTNVVSLAALAASPSKDGSINAVRLPDSDIAVFHADAPITYYGCSLGHILGGTVAAVSADIDRAVLQVGGAGFSQIFSRSFSFGSLLAMLDGRFDTRADSLLSLVQLTELLASVDPITWTDKAAAKPHLIQVGHADTSVPLVAARLHGRSLQLGWIAPEPSPPWGLKVAAAEVAKGAYVEVDMGYPDPAVLAIPPLAENPVHEGVRRIAVIVKQTGLFLRSGEVQYTCDGACDPD